ncbi:hypothetical protein [Caballeronia grimmiae]|uniref:hypothetical protein n=1 Tax=Caballeronia grimmiae TaxID=1071679 RepID=UPI000B324073
MTIIAIVWTVCALFAVLFIRGATAQERKPARVAQRRELGNASNGANAVKTASRAS